MKKATRRCTDQPTIRITNRPQLGGNSCRIVLFEFFVIAYFMAEMPVMK